MTKVVLDIGNCNPDHAAIASMLKKHFDVQVLRAHQWSDAQTLLQSQSVDLILINRKLDIDYSDGIEILRALKTSTWRNIPVMLITNYAEHQQQAISEGAVLGFGKLELSSPETHEKLRAVLGRVAVEG